MSVRDVLRTITADELHDAIDADVSAHLAKTRDATHIVEWLASEYPELFEFALGEVGRYVEDPSQADESTVNLIIANTAVTLGAFCRILEARELPSIT